MDSAASSEPTTSQSQWPRNLFAACLIGITIYCGWWIAGELERRQEADSFEFKAKLSAAHLVRELEHQVDNFTRSFGQKPTVEQFEKFMDEDNPSEYSRLDPWGRVVEYRRHAEAPHESRPFIYSVGPNGVDENGLGDDISNINAKIGDD